MSDFLTTNDAALRLGVAPSTVKRWADAGALSCERTAGGHRRFRGAVLERFRESLEGGKGAALGEASVGSMALGLEQWIEALTSATDTHAVIATLFDARGRLGARGEQGFGLLPASFAVLLEESELPEQLQAREQVRVQQLRPDEQPRYRCGPQCFLRRSLRLLRLCG